MKRSAPRKTPRGWTSHALAARVILRRRLRPFRAAVSPALDARGQAPGFCFSGMAKVLLLPACRRGDDGEALAARRWGRIPPFLAA
jgi:hypothetical protein